jgi:hypothetical protein
VDLPLIKTLGFNKGNFMIQKNIITLILSLLCGISEAQDLNDINKWGMVTIGEEDPYYILPSGFSPQDTRYKKTDISYGQYFYKDGANSSNWQEQIVLKAVKGKPDLATGHNVEALRELLAEGVKKNCPSDFYRANEEQLGDKKIGLVMGCRKLPIDENTGIIGYHIIIEGTDSMFAIAREARVLNYDDTSPIFESELKEWKAHLQQTVICAKNDICIHKTKP